MLVSPMILGAVSFVSATGVATGTALSLEQAETAVARLVQLKAFAEDVDE